jgi:hypothetical protein
LLNLILQWTLAHALGGAIVGFLESWRFQFMATLVFTGPIIGVCQWWLLRRILHPGRWWIFTTAIAWFLAMFVAIAGSLWLTPIVADLHERFGLWEVFWLNLVNGTVEMAVVGTVQWSMLFFQGWNGGFWILASALGGMLMGASGASLCAEICQALPSPLGGTLANAGAWAAYGVVTGGLLTWRSWNRRF